MTTKWEQRLDYVLVPLGLAVMVGYHLWLLLRIRRRPATTVIGINAINRRIWVRHIMEDPSGKHAVLAVQTMRNSIMASSVLATVAITLSSLVAALMASGAAHGLLSGTAAALNNSDNNNKNIVVGAAGVAALSAKFLAILVCFLVAFLLSVQSIRYYSHTGILVNVPIQSHRLRHPGLAVDYICHLDAQPRQLLLVPRRQGLLLLLPDVPLALRAHPHVRRLRRHGLLALLPRRLQGVGQDGEGRAHHR
jgi:hypothetical protein